MVAIGHPFILFILAIITCAVIGLVVYFATRRV